MRARPATAATSRNGSCIPPLFFGEVSSEQGCGERADRSADFCATRNNAPRTLAQRWVWVLVSVPASGPPLYISAKRDGWTKSSRNQGYLLWSKHRRIQSIVFRTRAIRLASE